MPRFALVGASLAHSYSKEIHQKLYQINQLEATYELVECQKEDLPKILQLLKQGVYHGLNITIPYKLEIMKYLDEVHASSINTVVYRDQKLIGYNTDYYGFKKTFTQKGFCVIIGNGGAAQSVKAVLNDIGVKYLVIGRNDHHLLDEISEIDVLINTTPIGMYPNINEMPVSLEVVEKSRYVYDLIYNPAETKLLKNAKSGCNGLLMLKYQALKAIEIWFNKEGLIIDE